MNEQTAAILLGSLAAVLIVGYTVYRTIQSHKLRKRLEDEAWQRFWSKINQSQPIPPWEYKTRSRPDSIKFGTRAHQQFEDRQKALYRQQVGRTKRGGK